jgi:hypothetical protein
MIVKFIDSFRDNWRSLARFGYLALILLALWDALLVDKSYAHTSIELVPAFWSLFGIGSCVLIIFISRIFGLGIKAREDYYDR